MNPLGILRSKPIGEARSAKRRLAILLGATLLGGCSGGPAVVPATVQPARPHASVRLVINIPKVERADLGAKFISGFTRSISVTMSGSSTGTSTVNVSEATVVTMNLDAFAGSNTFTVTGFSGNDGTGSVISTGSVTQTLAANEASTIPITIQGVPATITLGTLADPFPLIGTPLSQTLTVTVRDAGGAVITGTYSTAVTLSRTDTNNRAPLSTTTVAGSSTTVTSDYNGGGIQGDLVTYSASAGAVTSNSVTLTPIGPLVLSSSTVDIRSIGTGLNVTASQINGTVASSIGTCGPFASLSQSGTANSRTLSITGNAVGICTITVTGTDVPNQTIDVGVTSTALTIN